jgi:DNA ligase-1
MTRKFAPLCSAKVFAKDKATTDKHIAMLKFPALVSIKWDGWRMFEYGGRALCRSMDPPKNLHVQKTLAEMFRDMKERTGLVGLDGEAIGGSDRFARNGMQLSTSAFGSVNKVMDFTFNAFDSSQFADKPFTERLDMVANAVDRMRGDWPFLYFTEHHEAPDLERTMNYLSYVTDELGAEGIMGRRPDGVYKMGRSTMKDGILWALKPYEDGECVIEELHEMMENQNEATINSRGNTQRSGHQANMVPKGTFGRAVCRDTSRWEKTFNIGMGPGLNDELRKYIWEHKDEFIGATLKYKFQAIGCVDRPRQPKWMGIRPAEDMAK